MKKTKTDADQGFIEAFAALLAPWGMNVTSGRVYGYILLQQQPVTIDQMADELRMSRVGVWHAARRLEGFGHVRRYGEPGSKRALYGPTDSFSSPLLRQCALFGELSKLLGSQASAPADEATAARLLRMSALFAEMKDVVESTVLRHQGQQNAA